MVLRGIVLLPWALVAVALLYNHGNDATGIGVQEAIGKNFNVHSLQVLYLLSLVAMLASTSKTPD